MSLPTVDIIIGLEGRIFSIIEGGQLNVCARVMNNVQANISGTVQAMANTDDITAQGIARLILY